MPEQSLSLDLEQIAFRAVLVFIPLLGLEITGWLDRWQLTVLDLMPLVYLLCASGRAMWRHWVHRPRQLNEDDFLPEVSE